MVVLMRKILYFILKFINSIIPKENMILFTSTPNYDDNAYALFKKAHNKYGNNFRMVWLLECNDVIRKYENVVYVQRHSLVGLYYFFRAKFIFHTHGLYLNAFSKNQKVFSLWHGMPLKKIQHLFPKDMEDIANSKMVFELTIASSMFMAQIVSLCFGCGIDMVKITGLPRNDLLFQRKRFLGTSNNEKIIIWMPTYRDSNRRKEGEQYVYGIPLIDINNIFEINALCKVNNVKLFIKMHPLQKVVEKIPRLENVIVVNYESIERGVNFYSYLGAADALLTDYSSVYIDFLSVDKPIGFVLDDFEKYADDRGFVFDKPLQYMPGAHIYNIEDLKVFICEVANEIDSTKILRDTVGMKLNKFRDDKNAERVLNEILSFIK